MKLYSLIFFLTFLSCSKKSNSETNNKDKFNMINTIKKYDFEPIYRLEITSSLSYIIKINGLTTAIKNQNAGNTRWFLINNCIPNSGEQDIEITVLPKMNEEGTKHQKFIQNNSIFELKVELTSWKNGSLVAPEIVFEHNLSDNDYSNKMVYEHKTTFKAEVPYQLLDWKKGKSLKDIDSLQLQEDVVKSFKKIKENFENQEGEQFIKSVEAGMFNIAQSAYLKPEEYQELKRKKVSFINKQPRVLEKIENYKVEISGDGKLVSLRRIDGYNFGEGVLRRKYKKNGQETVHIDDVVFYAPLKDNSGKNIELQVVSYQNLVKPFFP